MIRSKQEYRDYLKADKVVNHVRWLLFVNKIYRYIKSMKRVEYIMNCRIGKLASMLFLWYRYKLRRLSVLTSIPAKMISNKGFKN